MTEKDTNKNSGQKPKLTALQVFGANLNTVYRKQIENFLGDPQTASKFISSIVADCQRNPKLLTCTQSSLINAYMTMAQMGFMPSSISGEAYLIPYNISKKVIENGKEVWVKEMTAQLQIGYQGLVTLFYKAGIEKIVSGIVRANDKTTYINGQLQHEVDHKLSVEQRGEAIGAYVIVRFKGVDNIKYMNGTDIVEHAKKFSKSYNPTGKDSPWNPANDPELWMWMKTVLKQHAKLLPKNENINKALEIDNRDSKISDMKDKLLEDKSLSMGTFLVEKKKTSELIYDNENSDQNQGEDEIQIGETDSTDGIK